MSQAKRELRLILESRSTGRRDRFRKKLSRFFTSYASDRGRDFPWRQEITSAFHLLLAEVLLKQTRAPDVVKPWHELVRRYPDPRKMSRARLATLERILEPLGLHRQRASGLKDLAAALCERHEGDVPPTLGALLELPHVGVYSACAVRCFAGGEQLPIVDANVLRVLSRLFGEKLGRDARRSRLAWELAWSIMPTSSPEEHNYGMLDFAAEVCKPRAPLCEECSLRNSCTYAAKLD